MTVRFWWAPASVRLQIFFFHLKNFAGFRRVLEGDAGFGKFLEGESVFCLSFVISLRDFSLCCSQLWHLKYFIFMSTWLRSLMGLLWVVWVVQQEGLMADVEVIKVWWWSFLLLSHLHGTLVFQKTAFVFWNTKKNWKWKLILSSLRLTHTLTHRVTLRQQLPVDLLCVLLCLSWVPESFLIFNSFSFLISVKLQFGF